MEKKNNITPFEIDVAKWYSDLVNQAELIEYGPVKGSMFFQPYGYAIWDLIRNGLDKRFKLHGVENVYFPLLMPEKLLQLEKDHIEGFAPEVLTITRVGKDELSEPLVVRPTSEMLFNTFFAQKLKSYKQLPYKLNQWVNVVRWENNTKPFLRNSEFLWQEGHTNHANKDEALNFASTIANEYYEFVTKSLRIPLIAGEKPSHERFAGAENSFTIETILKDGQALQMGTSHYLGQKFSSALNVKVLSENNQMFNPYQTSWGVSTRLIGGLIMTHSDNSGLVLPSEIAPYQIVVMTLFADKDENVLHKANHIRDVLSKKFRVKLDSSNKGIGFKSQEWEVKGVPIRIEVGPRDLANNQVTVVKRNDSSKQLVNISELLTYIKKAIKQYDKEIYKKAELNIESRIVKNVKDISQVKEIVENKKYVYAYWSDDAEVAKQLKTNTGATIRCLLKTNKIGKCIHSKKETNTIAIIARAY